MTTPGERTEIAMTKTLTAIGLAAVAFSMTACGSATSPVSPAAVAGGQAGMSAGDPTTLSRPPFAAAAKPGPLTIVGIVLQDDGEFDVLQAAVVRAGLVEALNGRTQYTV